jgi:hypothetical protein
VTSLLSARIAGSTVDTVLRFDQIKAFGKHTVATLDVSYPSSSRPWLAEEWAPVEVYLGGTTWYGYVHHSGVSSDVRDRSGSVVRYTLIGTSLPMNTERTRSWRGISASGVVRQVAREHRLRSVISRHRTVMPYYAQAGSSDWKVLQDMASRTGHRLWVDGSTAIFVDPSLLLEGVRALDIPEFSQNQIPGQRDTLFSFASKSGAMVPRATGITSRQVVHGLDMRTARPLKATATPSGPGRLLSKVNTDVRATTSGQAADIVSARATTAAGWITATALVVGSPEIVPGSLVAVSGSKVPEDQSGRWMVTEVNHRVLLDASNPLDPFTTALTLERDRYYGPGIRAATRASSTRDSVPATMRNGLLWEAEYMEDVNVG